MLLGWHNVKDCYDTSHKFKSLTLWLLRSFPVIVPAYASALLHYIEHSCRWLAGEIWLKSAGLTSQHKLAFYDFFCRFQVQLVGVAQKLQKK